MATMDMDSPSFFLHPQLQRDSHVLFEDDLVFLLLHRNAAVKWLMLVPKTEKSEWHELTLPEQAHLQRWINRLAGWLKQDYLCDKINIAALGNVVAQLHIHIIGRFKTDSYWPDPVWGKPVNEWYSSESVSLITEQLKSLLKKSDNKDSSNYT